MGPAIRLATPDDVPAIRALLRAHGNDSEVAPGGVDVVGPYVRHLVDRHVAMVSVEAGALVGFAATVDTGRCRMLADLFVDPARLGEGIGRPLLAAVLGDAPARATFASDDPRALPLYVRAGMAPLWPNLYLEGDAARLPPDPPPLSLRDAAPGEGAALELAWIGDDRPADHAHWASGPAADAFVVEDAAGALAIGYARARQVGTARVLNRLLVRPGAEPRPAVLAAIRRAARGGDIVSVQIPGPNPALPALLEVGFRVVDRDQFMASAPDLVDPARLLPNPGLL